MLRLTAAAMLLALVTVTPAGSAPPGPPSETTEAARALADATWQAIEDGLDMLWARSAGGVALTVLRIDPERFALGLVAQSGPDGELVETMAQRAGAVVGVNGGFFGERDQGRGLYPVGLFRLEGREGSRNWARRGGYAVIDDGRLRLLPSQGRAPSGETDIVQSKPMLIEPGGVWAMNRDDGLQRPRTALCIAADGKPLIMVVSGAGLSLYQAGWLLRHPADGGVFGCDAALALDGGGSTQMWVAGRDDLAVEGETPVHNAIVVTRR